MTNNRFMEMLMEKTWRSNGASTLYLQDYNDYDPDDWRSKLIEQNDSYYPPDGVSIEVVPLDIPRSDYSVPHNGSMEKVPATVLKTFRFIVKGTEFAGKKFLNAARFIVAGDHAISSPLHIETLQKSVVVVVRLKDLSDGRRIMVNELIWSVQYENAAKDSQVFYDIQKWYCCGYP